MKQCLIVVLILFSTNAVAEINKWVDENNQVHYSDQPPPSSSAAKKLRTSSDSKDAPKDSTSTSGEGETTESAAPKTIAQREAELKKAKLAKQEAADKAAQNQSSDEARKAICTSLQQNLRALESGVRISEVTPSGENAYLDDEQRQQRIAKVQQNISKSCK